MAAARSAPRLVLRPASVHDGPGVAALLTATWREGFRGRVADDYLDGALAADVSHLVEAMLKAPAPALTLVAAREGAVGAGAVLGVLSTRPERREDGPVDRITGVAVRPEARGQGLATALIAAAAGRLAARGHGPAVLTVLPDNRPARRLYAGLGGLETGPVPAALPGGGTTRGLQVAWPDLGTLALVARSALARRQ